MAPKKDDQSPNAAQSRVDALRPLCIVVADDDRDTVLSLEMLLRAEGHEVHPAYDTKQTLDQILRHDPDALLLDIALGSGSGFEVARAIRARHGEKRPLIVGLSGIYKKGSDRVLADLTGINHYFVKPYDPNALLATLEPLRLPRRRADDGQTQDRTYRAALSRAAGLVGGARELSDRLRVPMTDLTRWLAGEGRPMIDVFLRVVDILVEEGNRPPPEPPSGEIVEFRKPPKPIT